MMMNSLKKDFRVWVCLMIMSLIGFGWSGFICYQDYQHHQQQLQIKHQRYLVKAQKYLDIAQKTKLDSFKVDARYSAVEGEGGYDDYLENLRIVGLARTNPMQGCAIMTGQIPDLAGDIAVYFSPGMIKEVGFEEKSNDSHANVWNRDWIFQDSNDYDNVDIHDVSRTYERGFYDYTFGVFILGEHLNQMMIDKKSLNQTKLKTTKQGTELIYQSKSMPTQRMFKDIQKAGLFRFTWYFKPKDIKSVRICYKFNRHDQLTSINLAIKCRVMIMHDYVKTGHVNLTLNHFNENTDFQASLPGMLKIFPHSQYKASDER